MASLSALNLTSTLSRSSFSSSSSSSSLGFLSPSILSLPIRNHRLRSCPTITTRRISIRALTLDFSGSFFEGGSEGDRETPSTDGSTTAVAEKEEPQCPPGLRQYETMAVLRPDMSEEERLALTQKYEEVPIRKNLIFPPILVDLILC